LRHHAREQLALDAARLVELAIFERALEATRPALVDLGPQRRQEQLVSTCCTRASRSIPSRPDVVSPV
jgi:hypothetical protein